MLVINYNSLFIIPTKVGFSFINKSGYPLPTPCPLGNGTVTGARTRREFSTTVKTMTLAVKSITPMWVTGLADAEGSFIISIFKRKQCKNLQINPTFQLWLNSKDKETLQALQEFFGVGVLNTRIKKDVTSFTVSNLSDLVNVIIPHFKKFPLQTQKRVDFELFCQILELKYNGEHLTPVLSLLLLSYG